MGKPKKAFIDRKKAVTFHLVHRSQHDPLVTDETAPQHVLVEAKTRQQSEPMDSSKRREEQRKYGIQFDDDYDYMQHLKKRDNDVVWEYVENPNHSKKCAVEDFSNGPKLNLPSSVFASEFEEEEGMLNKAALHPGPRPDWDPDVVAALDGDFECDEDFDDDFVIQLMGENNENDNSNNENDSDDDSDESYGSDNLNNDEFDDELMDRLAPLMREKHFNDEETKSRFTEYSISSSVMRRNEQLSLLDDRFERFYASYDDTELGDLAMEEIEGTWHHKHPYVLDCLKEFKRDNKILEYNKEWDKARIEKYGTILESDSDSTEELVNIEVEDSKEKKWDCESILSTYSNIYNHPKLIDEPRRRKLSSSCSVQKKIDIDLKTGLPTNVLRGGPDNNLTAKALAKLNDNSDPSATGPKSLCGKSMISTLSVLSIRPNDETPEEKRERKRLLKMYRNDRRSEKKANREAFKDETKRQRAVKINQRMNQQGSRID